jgi:hypothetical protein
MRSPCRLILWDQESGKSFSDIIARGFECGTAHAVSHAVTKRHQPINHRRRCSGTGCLSQSPQQFAFTGWRQMMKQRQMRAKLITLRREMRAAFAIEPRKIQVPKQGRNDNRCGNRQIST